MFNQKYLQDSEKEEKYALITIKNNPNDLGRDRKTTYIEARNTFTIGKDKKIELI